MVRYKFKYNDLVLFGSILLMLCTLIVIPASEFQTSVGIFFASGYLSFRDYCHRKQLPEYRRFVNGDATDRAEPSKEAAARNLLKRVAAVLLITFASCYQLQLTENSGRGFSIQRPQDYLLFLTAITGNFLLCRWNTRMVCERLAI